MNVKAHPCQGCHHLRDNGCVRDGMDYWLVPRDALVERSHGPVKAFLWGTCGRHGAYFQEVGDSVMVMTPIEMARECAAAVIEQQPENGDGFHMRNTAAGVRAGAFDGATAMQVSLAMHAMRQPEIDALKADVAELVEALETFGGDFAETFIDDEGWKSPMRKERIIDWFGPSDFRKAQHLISKHGEPK